MVWMILLAALILVISVVILLQAKQLVKLLTRSSNYPPWMEGLPYYGRVVLLLAAASMVIYLNGWEAHILNWLNLLVRWTHVIIGIAWIGASFYFVFLENSLNRTENIREELAGNLWAIHGGGFYYVEKYKVAPAEIPKKLHWFKYEAYFTWITGILLMIIVYYSQANVTMVGQLQLGTALSIFIGVGSLLAGWLVYDGICRTWLIDRPIWFFLVMFGFIVLMAWLLSYLLSAKAAYMHVGAMLGTMMAGNVFRVIIPSQKAMVKAAESQEPLDPYLGQHAGLRSLHNNYFTLPVVFIMISGHFPSTFGHPYNWAVLGGLFLVSAGIRHYLNLIEKGQQAFWILPFATLGVIVLAFITAPPASDQDLGEEVSFQEIRTIFTNRCNTCHAANPTDELWVAAPNGVMFDTPDQIVAMKDQIMMRVVVTETMPMGNTTNITPEERDMIRRWILQGATVN